jgi:ferredoxin
MTKVRFVGSDLNKVVDIKIGSLILDGALCNGIELPYGCRYGSCYACAVEVLKGIENIDSPSTSSTKNKKTSILTCVSKIKKNGDIVIKV